MYACIYHHLWWLSVLILGVIVCIIHTIKIYKNIIITCNILIKDISDIYLLKECGSQFTVHVKLSSTSFSLIFAFFFWDRILLNNQTSPELTLSSPDCPWNCNFDTWASRLLDKDCFHQREIFFQTAICPLDRGRISHRNNRKNSDKKVLTFPRSIPKERLNYKGKFYESPWKH